MIKTITLTGGEQEVKFAGKHQYFHVHSLSGEVLVSLTPEVERGKDDVLIVSSGGAGYVHIGLATDTVYLAGSGEVQIAATGNAFSPFNFAAKGGGASESGGTLSSGGVVSGTVNYPIVALNMYGKSVQDGTPTTEAPVDVVSIGDDGNIKITSCGKNLFKNTASKQTSNGVTFTINADGTAVTANGTALSGAWAIFVLGTFTFKAGKTYVLSGCPAGGDAASTYRMIALVDGKEVIGGDYGEGVTIAVDNDTTVTIRIDVISDYTASNLVFYPMIRYADMSNDYEPYKGSTATITSNLPLCSVGEVRDELIYNVDGTGKIIKRTARISSYNGETIATDYISSTGELDAGAEVIYILDTPQEKALSSNEITGLMQLQTFNDMTIIYNDENAEMTAKIATNPFLSEYIFPVLKGLMTNSAAMSAFLGV